MIFLIRESAAMHQKLRFRYASGIMKYKYLFLAAPTLILLAIVLVLAGFRGDANVTAGSSLASNTVRLCGAATGGWAIAALASVLLGIVVFILALIDMARHAGRKLTPKHDLPPGGDAL
jgi:hypothetical protein